MNKIYNNLTAENLIKTEWFNQFDKKQQEQIILGIENNINIHSYAKPIFKWFQMSQIRVGLKDDLDISWFAKKEFDEFQMSEIRFGLKDKLDVSIYAKEEFV